MQVEEAYAAEVTKLVEYVDCKKDPLTRTVRMHQHSINPAVLQTARLLKIELERVTRQTKESIAKKTKERWPGRRMHGQLPRNLDEKPVDNEQSYQWLKFGDIKGETESTIVADQDQAISANYFKNKIFKEETDSKCW
jgi:hypothetical protein